MAPRLEPWRISTLERLEQWRLLADEALAGDSAGAKSRDAVVRVSGRERPELFFQWQLLEHLLSNAFIAPPEHRAIYRQGIETRAAALGFGADLWSHLERAGATWIENRERQAGLADRLASAGRGELPRLRRELDQLAAADCELRSAALDAAAHAFGARELERLLYRAVAPDFNVVANVSDLDLDQLRRIQEGCQ
jgi:hypothetical protein